MKLKFPKWFAGVAQTLIAIVFTGLFISFLYHERFELKALSTIIHQTNIFYLGLGIITTGLYFVIQALFYRACLAVLGKTIPLKTAVTLFLKRFFIGAFLPAGFTVSQYAFTRDLKPYDINRLENNVASTIYLITGIISYTIILIPTILYLLSTNRLISEVGYGSLVTVIAVAWLSWQSYLVVTGHGLLYRLLQRLVPDFTDFIAYWRKHTLKMNQLIPVVCYAFAVDLGGALLLLAAMLAFHLPPSFSLALIGYVLTILLLTISPFEGIGIIEFALVYIFRQFGANTSSAVATILLYRLFQLWIPFFAGFILIVYKRIASWLNPTVLASSEKE